MRRIIFLILALIYLPFGSVHGSYNEHSRTAYCTDRLTCTHEIGHAMDKELGWISQTADFQITLESYLNDPTFDMTRFQVKYFFENTTQNPYKESYAWIFAYADGNLNDIPIELRNFYDMELTREYLPKAQSYIMIFW